MTSRALVAALAASALLGSACLTRSVESFEEVAPEQVLVDPPQPGAPPPAVEEGGTGEPQQVEQRDDIENPSASAWTSTSWSRDTRELTVFWTSGVEPCTAFAGIDVNYLEDEVEVTVLEGAPPEAATISCVMMAVDKQHTIVLDEDLAGRRIIDGATARG